MTVTMPTLPCAKNQKHSCKCPFSRPRAVKGFSFTRLLSPDVHVAITLNLSMCLGNVNEFRIIS